MYSRLGVDEQAPAQVPAAITYPRVNPVVIPRPMPLRPEISGGTTRPATLDPAQIPDVSTTPPSSMTDAQINEEYTALSSIWSQYVNRVPADNPRFAAVVNRRNALNQERENRRARSTTFDAFVAAAPPGLALGAGIAYLLGRSPVKGGVIGGLVTGLLPVVILTYLYSARPR